MRRASVMLLAIMLGLTIGLAGRARADQNDPRLEALFQELRVVTGYLRARTLEQQIWEIWTASSNPEVNRLMDDGVTAMATQDYKTALADFTKVIEAAPDFAEGWNKRATVRYMRKDFTGAVADCQETLSRNPHHFGAASGQGLCHMALGQYREAAICFRRALEIHPHLAAVRYNLTLAESQGGGSGYLH
jgi:tetratricopeptide (TPR) repeat protein